MTLGKSKTTRTGRRSDSLVDHPVTDDDAAVIRARREQRVVPVVGHAPQSLLMMSVWTETQDRPVSVLTAEGHFTEPLQVPEGDIHSFDRPSITNNFPRVCPRLPKL